MKNLIAIAAVALTLPMAASAQVERVITCTVAEIENNVGVCARVEMPQPPMDVRVRVITKKGAQLGGLTPGAAGLTFLGLLAVGAAMSGGGSSNGTN
jgi:hypothetical protein